MTLLFASLLIVFFLPINAFAYIDPGAGSVLLQSLIGGFFVAVGVLVRFRDKVVSVCRRLIGKPPKLDA